jgi:release factor glutamine methyltransferase
MPEMAVSLRTVLERATERLRRVGIPEARREALRIWSDLDRRTLGEGWFTSAVDPEPDTVTRYQEAVDRRAGGEPLAHVTGWTGFRHLVLRSDPRALIPRPETEGLVELLLERRRTGRVADMGTGSGCIALSLAQEGGFDLVVGVDRSAEALELAAVNRQLTGGRVELIRSDFGSALGEQSFDALISNPPYLTLQEYSSLDRSVGAWEPRLALIGGDDGLEATARVLRDGLRVVRSGGWLALEVDCNRAAAAAHLAAALGWDTISVERDLFGRERYLLARRSCRS